MTVRAIFACSIDGDSLLTYNLKAIAQDIPAAVRWIMAHPISPGPDEKPAHPIMTAANNWSFYGSRKDVDLLEQQLKAGDFGYIIEEMIVA